MKKTFSSAATALVLGLALAGPASAALSTGNLQQDIDSAVGGDGNINAYLNDGVVTLTGNTDSTLAKVAAEQAARHFDGVNDVVNLVGD